ncbi:MAG: hypothetical protein Q9227_001167 [Pyrenula ochraceoflavens]
MEASRFSKTKIAKAGGPLSAQYDFQKDKNKKQPRLPPNVKVQRRPILHPPIANPYAGANVPKVVYVSASTPVMAAVKRTEKLLDHIEKRALQGIKLPEPRSKDKEHGDFARQLEEASSKVTKEAVYIKASGRAVEKALRIGEWFRRKESGMKVEVKTGSTVVVDDLVEVDEGEDNDRIRDVATEHNASGLPAATAQNGENSTEEKGQLNEAALIATTDAVLSGGAAPTILEASISPSKPLPSKRAAKKSRRKRKRDVYDLADMPEARTRWIKNVEVAILPGA